MLAEIYLLQLELAAQAAEDEKSAVKHDYDFVPFQLDAFASAACQPKRIERPTA